MLKLIQTKLKGFAEIEFWAVTGLIALCIVSSFFDLVPHTSTVPGAVPGAPNTVIVNENIIQFSGLKLPVLFSYLVTYIIYLLLCFFVTPEFEKEEGNPPRSTVFVFAIIAIGVGVDIVNVYFAALIAIKIWVIWFNRVKRNKANFLSYEAAMLTACWILTSVSLAYLSADRLIMYYVIITLPFAAAAYLYAKYKILPSLQNKKYPALSFAGRFFLLMIFTLACMGLVSYLMGEKQRNIPNIPFSPFQDSYSITPESIMGTVVISGFFTMLIIVWPASWRSFKRDNKDKDEEIYSLKSELGRSDANFSFLKSQINPHFLFNALNTLYGTALQENAERTGEGIQKLGDMMRFMLQENEKDSIALTRDMDYLNNYILLQKLRTATSPNIIIQVDIDTEVNPDLMIAPMLLIPFVENAFKHGISLISNSLISVALHIKGNTLYFDVHNTIHIKPDNDPEKGSSGIGLDNVKQRLQLLYPDKHELVIRDNAKDFFVHLTLQLNYNY